MRSSVLKNNSFKFNQKSLIVLVMEQMDHTNNRTNTTRKQLIIIPTYFIYPMQAKSHQINSLFPQKPHKYSPVSTHTNQWWQIVPSKNIGTIPERMSGFEITTNDVIICPCGYGFKNRDIIPKMRFGIWRSINMMDFDVIKKFHIAIAPCPIGFLTILHL